MLGELAAALARETGRQEFVEREILAITDRERVRFGQELHDGLCQSLAGIAALAAVLARNLADGAPHQPPAAAAAEIVGLLNETIAEARDLAHGLSPIGPDGTGLIDALETLARNASRSHGAFCGFFQDGPCPDFRHDTVVHLVRITQEAVRNAITHGQAEEIEIRLACVDGSGHLSIRDNGVGLSKQERRRAGIGLRTMESRARAIGGSLMFAPQPERGVLVACTFPCGDAACDADDAPALGKNVLIVDDHPVLRRGLAALIESAPDLVLHGAVGTRATALATIRERQPDLAIVDLALGGDDGLDLVKEIKTRYPGVPSLVLSVYDEAQYAERALAAGARGYVSKQQLEATVLVAIRRVLAGDTYMSDALQRRLARQYLGGRRLETGTPIDALSDRELQVFRLVGQGRTTRQIAATLGRSVKTIESHLAHIKNKLTIDSAAELAQRATQWVETSQIA